MPDQCARINAVNRDDVPAFQISVEGFLRAPTGSYATCFAHHEALDPRAIRFFVFTVNTVVANQRIGHTNDLTGVGGIGKDLLVTRHRGIEDHLAGALAFRRPRSTVESAAIFEGEECGIAVPVSHR